MIADDVAFSMQRLRLYGAEKLNEEELWQVLGDKSEAAVRLLAARELDRRQQIPAVAVEAISEPRHVLPFLDPLFIKVGGPCPNLVPEVNSWTSPAEHERFFVLALDVRNRPLQVQCIAQGSIDRCPVDLREILAVALEARATALIVAHNHPSGEVQPSAIDKLVTRRLVKACATVGVAFLDHVIFVHPKKPEIFSFRGAGLISKS